MLRRLARGKLWDLIFVSEVGLLLDHHRLLLGQLVAAIQVELVFLQGQGFIQLDDQG